MTAKHTIVCVADEKEDLASMQREFTALENQGWKLECLDALQLTNVAALAIHPLIVFCDQQHGSVDGDCLLNIARESWPDAFRVFITDKTEADDVADIAASAHCIIPKPFCLGDAQAVIRRVERLSDFPIATSIKQQLNGITKIPLLPQIYVDLKELMKDENVTAQAVAELVSRDPVILAKLVQLANSSYLGYMSSTSSPVESVMRLGLDMVSKLVLTLGVFTKCDSLDEVFREMLLHESILTAEICQQLAKENGDTRAETERAFLLGMLHNIGYLVPTSSTIELPSEDNEAWPLQEHIIGAYILLLWDFDPSFASAVYYQSSPYLGPEATKISGYLYAANTVIKCKQAQIPREELIGLMDQSLLDMLGIWSVVVRTVDELP